jgi:hypothetical protein
LWLPSYGELLDVIEDLPELYQLWFMFLALTGMRPSEATGMRWDLGLIDSDGAGSSHRRCRWSSRTSATGPVAGSA